MTVLTMHDLEDDCERYTLFPDAIHQSEHDMYVMDQQVAEHIRDLIGDVSVSVMRHTWFGPGIKQFKITVTIFHNNDAFPAESFVSVQDARDKALELYNYKYGNQTVEMNHG